MIYPSMTMGDAVPVEAEIAARRLVEAEPCLFKAVVEVADEAIAIPLAAWAGRGRTAAASLAPSP